MLVVVDDISIGLGQLPRQVWLGGMGRPPYGEVVIPPRSSAPSDPGRRRPGAPPGFRRETGPWRHHPSIVRTQAETPPCRDSGDKGGPVMDAIRAQLRVRHHVVRMSPRDYREPNCVNFDYHSPIFSTERTCFSSPFLSTYSLLAKRTSTLSQ